MDEVDIGQHVHSGHIGVDSTILGGCVVRERMAGGCTALIHILRRLLAGWNRISATLFRYPRRHSIVVARVEPQITVTQTIYARRTSCSFPRIRVL